MTLEESILHYVNGHAPPYMTISGWGKSWNPYVRELTLNWLYPDQINIIILVVIYLENGQPRMHLDLRNSFYVTSPHMKEYLTYLEQIIKFANGLQDYLGTLPT